VSWSFADHRSCAEANVVDVVIVDDAGAEIVRVACGTSDVTLDDRASEAIVIEARGHDGTLLYSGRAVLRDARAEVTLRYVGGAAP
jgi:hypothetical protein